ncbi:hypothetical protein NL676_038374 [Syzygium grande]|nr:hypothetical protein NL676_038374 [Syzygium grande]
MHPARSSSAGPHRPGRAMVAIPWPWLGRFGFQATTPRAATLRSGGSWRFTPNSHITCEDARHPRAPGGDAPGRRPKGA